MNDTVAIVVEIVKHLPGQHDQKLHGHGNLTSPPSTSKLKSARKLLLELKSASKGQVEFVKELFTNSGDLEYALQRSELDLRKPANREFLKKLGLTVVKNPDYDKEYSEPSELFIISDTTKEAKSLLTAVQAAEDFFDGGSEKEMAKAVSSWMAGKPNHGLDVVWAVSQLTLNKKEYILNRGMQVPQKFLDKLMGGTIKKADVNTVGHWSVDFETSSFFGSEEGVNEGSGILFMMRVPKESIIIHSGMTRDDYGEEEFVPMIFGSPKILATTPYKTDEGSVVTFDLVLE